MHLDIFDMFIKKLYEIAKERKQKWEVSFMKKKLVLTKAATMAITSCAVPVLADDAAAEGGKIGISMPTQSLERWNRDGSYLEEQFKAAGYDVELTYSDNETDRQVNDIQNLISDGVNLLVVAAIDGEALNTVMDEAADAGIPVIAYDRLIKSDAVSYYISFDNYTVGTLQGQYVIDTLDLDNAGDKTYNIEFTAGDPADNNAGYFFNGAYDTLKPYLDAGTLNVVSGQTDFDSLCNTKCCRVIGAKSYIKLCSVCIVGSEDVLHSLECCLCIPCCCCYGIEISLSENHRQRSGSDRSYPGLRKCCQICCFYSTRNCN